MPTLYKVIRTFKDYYMIEADSEKEAVEKSNDDTPYSEIEEPPKVIITILIRDSSKTEVEQ